MKQYFCTYFDRNYLTRGLALIESLSTHCGDFTMYVVCMDEYTRLALQTLAIPQVQTVPFHEIERQDPDLASCRSKRELVEYIWTSTPAIIRHVLDRYPEITNLVYVDADLLFFSDPINLYDEMGEKTVLIHEHRFPPRHSSFLLYGRFNVGLLIFKNCPSAREVLCDWRAKCIDWCYARAEDGKFGDQKYLDEWPERFPCVHVTTNIGVGIAPWNHEQYHYSSNERGQPCVNGAPVIFYHYHSFKIVHPEVYIPAPDTVWPIPDACVKLCFMPYIQAIRRAQYRVERAMGECPFGFAGSNLTLGVNQVVLSSKGLTPELQRIGLSQPTRDLDAEWTIFQGAQYMAACPDKPPTLLS
jgi:hypothetical protein